MAIETKCPLRGTVQIFHIFPPTIVSRKYEPLAILVTLRTKFFFVISKLAKCEEVNETCPIKEIKRRAEGRTTHKAL